MEKDAICQIMWITLRAGKMCKWSPVSMRKIWTPITILTRKT